ncbi:hypothetical protein BUALT_Bualt01G0107300 [Buddleja alternifolia]|uniref:RRM domain-containing protein n=1 Tax=Buddleja alternifolia TaxID=168488 RepID=A0AAV6Y633_9LAMI|nr:hypothetical protein BUALT_Bualt01G0107300 [Buddleja alternifolia]
MTMMSNNNGGNNLGDTTLTKVFVGGLAWETPKEAMRDHFEKYGDILEAVTFKDAEAAKKACEDATPIINGRRANCNLAALGARRPRSSSTTTAAANAPPQQGVNVGPRAATTPPPANHVQWYYPAAAPAAAAPFHGHHHHHHQAVPFYGYSPTYIATPEMNYNHKVGFNGGSYMNGHYGQLYPGGQAMVGGNTLMPMYPLYHFHQSQTMGLPAHMYSPTAAGPIPLISKPTSIAPPNSVCLAVE